jgi:hypothetical protein
MNKISTLIISTLLLCGSFTSVLAKASAPMKFSLEKSEAESLGEQQRYTVTIKFSPLSKSERVMIKINLPDSYKLLEGIAYWEGIMETNAEFSKKLVIEGPTNTPAPVSVDARMDFEGSSFSSRTLFVQLTPESPKEISAYPPLVTNRLKAEENGKRVIRRY